MTSLYNDWEPTAKAEFAIGGSKDNYQLFYDYLDGKSNGYGQVSDANGRSTEAKKSIRKRRLRQKRLHQQQFLAVEHLA